MIEDGRPRVGPPHPNQRSEQHHVMSFTVFLGNLPAWVTADDIQSWLSAETLVADAIKVIRNPETQESKGFAFIDAPNQEEMQAIIRRFDRAPLEGKLLRANPAQPPKPKVYGTTDDRSQRRHSKRPKPGTEGPKSAFATELAKAL
jgi:RNA recognition motif-containing protein